MKITDTISKRLEEAIKIAGNVNQFAIQIGLPTETVRRWRNRSVTTIDDTRWAKLFPHIKGYFTELELELLTEEDKMYINDITARHQYDSEHGKGSFKLKGELELLEEKIAIAKKDYAYFDLEKLKERKSIIENSMKFLETYHIEYKHWDNVLHQEKSNHHRYDYDSFMTWCKRRLKHLDALQNAAIDGLLDNNPSETTYNIPRWLKEHVKQLINLHGEQVADVIMLSFEELENILFRETISEEQLKKLSPLLLTCNHEDIKNYIDKNDFKNELIFYTQSIIRETFIDPKLWGEFGTIAYCKLPNSLSYACIENLSKLKKRRKMLEEILQPIVHESSEPSQESFKAIPVISEDIISQWNPALSTWADFIRNNAMKEPITFPQAKTTDCMIKITSDSMSPWYPFGSYVLVRPNEQVKNGSRVVAKLATGKIVFKIFVISDNKVALLSINPNSDENLEFSTDDNFAFWIWPIKWSLRNEDTIDEELKKNDIPSAWESYFTQGTLDE